MLSTGTYKLEDLEAYFHTRNKQNTDNKLNRYSVKYTIDPATARSRNPTYQISEIPDPLPLYCVFDLGFDPRTDFTKLRNFLFYLFTAPDFSWRPAEMMEEYLRIHQHGISRQTISNYIRRLDRTELFNSHGDYVYYKVYKNYGVQEHEIISKEDYSRAWAIYWECIEKRYGSPSAFQAMYNRFGGVPRKQQQVMKNGIYNRELAMLEQWVCDSFLAEYGSQE